MRHLSSLFFAVGALSGLCGCGLSVPDIELGHPTRQEAASADANFVNAVAAHVNCELGQAVNQTVRDLNDANWLYTWSAKTTLTLTVDEKGSVKPGVSLMRNAFTLGIGANVDTDATRVQTITWFFNFAEFYATRNERRPCQILGDYPIQGSLKIYESVYSGAKTAQTLNTVSQPFETGGPLDVIEHHVTFDLVFGGNLTPSWKFVDVSANTDGNFLSASRDRKDDLLITMGPSQIADTKRKLAKGYAVVGPSSSVVQSHLAAQIGQAVSTGIRSSR
ncbi:hypothetical protein [uncultured Bradyrhizobium sp.]|uniref:hypothetical protein n=1 Tax=uncultured Bradyrhizobium sp. TaxID=199684 RepID=UPI0035CA6B6B